MRNFSTVFKELRMKSGLTQQEMADKLDISRSSVGMYESGDREPSFELLESIADYFNVDMNYLLGKKELSEHIPLGYYLNEDARKVAQEIFEKDKVLFDVYRSSDKDRLIAYANKLKALRDMEEGND